jgi:DNA-binding transcriptional ArsR family regulator
MDKKEDYTEKQIQIANFAKAMSHPARVFILQKLSKMNSCCYSGDLVNELPISRSALSLHLKELKNAGLINGHIKAPYIKYCINPDNWEIAKKLCKEMFDE